MVAKLGGGLKMGLPDAYGHRTDQPVFLMNGLILVRAILHPPVRMMNQRSASPAPLQRHFQSLADLSRMQTVMDVVSHDLA